MKKNSSDKNLTMSIVVLSVAGLLYFGLSAIGTDRKRGEENPFEYDIENLKKSGAELVTYREIKTLKIPFQAPKALAVDSRDRLYVTSDFTVIIMDSSGERLGAATIGNEINALDVSVTDEIYLAYRNGVQVLDSTGTPILSWQIPGARALLTSIAVGEQNVYLADAGQRVVWRYDMKGTLLNKIGEKDASKDVPGFIIPSPYFDVLIDPDGYLWAINTGRHQFENYLPDGTLRSLWSKTSMTVDGFSGCCNPAHVAILPDGSFVTSEKGILRIKIHKPIGEFDTVVAMPEQFDPDTHVLEVAVNSHGQIFVLDPQRAQIRVFEKKESLS